MMQDLVRSEQHRTVAGDEVVDASTVGRQNDERLEDADLSDGSCEVGHVAVTADIPWVRGKSVEGQLDEGVGAGRGGFGDGHWWPPVEGDGGGSVGC